MSEDVCCAVRYTCSFPFMCINDVAVPWLAVCVCVIQRIAEKPSYVALELPKKFCYCFLFLKKQPNFLARMVVKLYLEMFAQFNLRNRRNPKLAFWWSEGGNRYPVKAVCLFPLVEETLNCTKWDIFKKAECWNNAYKITEFHIACLRISWSWCNALERFLLSIVLAYALCSPFYSAAYLFFWEVHFKFPPFFMRSH